MRGALLTGLIARLPEAELTTLASDIESGTIKTLVVLNEDLTQTGIAESLLRKVDMLYFGTHKNSTSRCAKVELPTLTVFEKSGTFVNQQFRLQRFHQVVPGPAGLLADVHLLTRLLGLLAGEEPANLPSMDALWDEMATVIPAFSGISFASISDQGVLLDSTPYQSLPFSEGASLHYQPSVSV
jgi:NADH-quinone oxidoreductase subunit G